MVEPDVLVRAGGSFLLAVVGAGALIVSRRESGAVALGAFLVAQGIYWTGQNLFSGNAAAAVYWVPVALLCQAARCAALAVLFVAWPSRRVDRRWLFVAAALGLVVSVATFRAIASPGWELVHAGANVPDPSLAHTYARVFLMAANAGEVAAVAIGLPLRFLSARSDEPELARRLAWGGALIVLGPRELGDWLLGPGSLFENAIGSPLGASAFLIGIPLWLVATRGPHGRLAARVAIALAAYALAGMIISVAWGANDTVENSITGAQRSAFAFLYAYAIARAGLLGHAIQLRAARRGTVAMGALATLFIVAQVAQQFLAAQYGLLMGGIVAGTFLFAAAPLQRALEGRGASPPSRGLPKAVHEEVYKAAVRLALRGGIDPREQVELMRIADAHGITHMRAAALRREVEGDAREKGEE